MPVSRNKETEFEAPDESNDPRHVPAEKEFTEEPVDHDPARAAGAATAHHGSEASGKRALIQYDYEKAEDNELELIEGQYVSNIEMVDDDWWMGINQKGESGLFPSNYVELVEGEVEEAFAPAPEPVAPAASASPTAIALYDYEAAEDNELSFPEDGKITGLVSSPNPGRE